MFVCVCVCVCVGVLVHIGYRNDYCFNYFVCIFVCIFVCVFLCSMIQTSFFHSTAISNLDARLVSLIPNLICTAVFFSVNFITRPIFHLEF